MRLLVVTQVLDQDDPVLGFFVRWVEALASRVEEVTVVCLKEGTHDVPKNVRVYSLGKERGRPVLGSAAYAMRFLRLAWRRRRDHDAVFVHMNQEYVLIAGWLWKLLGTRVYLWRNHYAGSWLTDLAAILCTKVFCTSKHSYTAKYAKTTLMPVGVDTERFFPDARVKRRAHSILFLARMAPSKRPDLLIDALAMLARDGVAFTATFVGAPRPEDEAYHAALKERVRTLGLASRIAFRGAVTHDATPDLYRAHAVFVNASPSGMLDKTLFEAAACGCRVLASSDDWRALAGADSSFDSAETLAARLRAALAGEDAPPLAHVVEAHSLTTLAEVLVRRLAPRRALLFQNGSIGDFLMFVFLAEQLWRSGSFAEVVIAVPRNARFLASLVGRYPYIRVVTLSARRWGGFRDVIRARGRATVAILHPTIGRLPLRLKLIARLAAHGKGSLLIGFRDRGAGCRVLYTTLLDYDTSVGYDETMRRLAAAAGAAPDPGPPRLVIEEEPEAPVRHGLVGKRYVVFHPGASNPRRAFSVADASAVVTRLLADGYSEHVVLSAGPEERTYAAAIARASGASAVSLAVGLPAGELATLLTHAALCIGTDTGITHLACFLGARVLEVAHGATANWLAYYAPSATVLYRLEGEADTRTDRAYLEAHRAGRLRPFTNVPAAAVTDVLRLQ